MKSPLRRTIASALVTATLINAIAPINAFAFKGNMQTATPAGSSSSFGGAQRYQPSPNPSFQNRGPSNTPSTPSPDASRPEGLVGDWSGTANVNSGPLEVLMRIQADGVFKLVFRAPGGDPAGFQGQWYVSQNQLIFTAENGEDMKMPIQPTSANSFKIQFAANGPVVDMQRVGGPSQPQPNRPQPQPRHNTQPNPYATPNNNGFTTPSYNPPRQNGTLTAQQVVGSWSGQAQVQGVTIQTQVVFQANGRVHVQAIIIGQGQGTTNVQIAGNWQIRGNRVVCENSDGVEELVIQNGALMLPIEDVGITIPLYRN